MMVNGLVGTVLSTLEQGYDLTPQQSSWIVSAYDVSTVPMLILVLAQSRHSLIASWQKYEREMSE